MSMTAETFTPVLLETLTVTQFPEGFKESGIINPVDGLGYK